MEEGTILKWLKTEGDLVSEGEVLFEMETDKAISEVPSPASGTLLRIVRPEGQVKVEEIVAWIGQPGETIDLGALGGTQALSLPTLSSTDNTSVSQHSLKAHKVIATPAARRRAAELKVDLTTVEGTGPGGRIVQEDVEKAGQSMKLVKLPKATLSLSDRKCLIRQLTTTWQSVPHIHISRRLNADELMKAKTQADSNSASEVSITDLILYILSRLLPRFPGLTMVWSGEELMPASQINLAFAVDTDRGVVAPVIVNATALSLPALSKRRQELTVAARSHHLRLEEVQAGVFTLTNLGMEGIDTFAPILNAPQTAILAIGRITQEPVVIDGSLGIGWRVWANLAADHRVTDGVLAGHFLSALQKELDQLFQNAG